LQTVDRATMDKARKLYYYYMGWNSNGVPTQEKVEELYID
jgi:aldehyde:ferredoxin oxidoreductase